MNARLAAVLTLLVAPVPGRAAVARVDLAPSTIGVGAPAAPSFAAPTISFSAAPSFAAPVLAAPALAAPALAPAASLPEGLSAALSSIEPAAWVAPAEPGKESALTITKGADGRLEASFVARETAKAAPDEQGRAFDGAAAPLDFSDLTPVVTVPPAARWTPSSLALKPLAAAFNAASAARRAHRIARLGADGRVTGEELGLRSDLTKIHAALLSGDPQTVVGIVSAHFQTAAARDWYDANPRYGRYRERAFAYFRVAEDAIMASYEDAAARGADPVLVAEARAAARSGRAVGHAWRPTPIQDQDSGHCVQNALYNAIAASAGFASPTTVARFVAASRELLNRQASLSRPATPAQIAAVSREFGVSLGRREVGEGMTPRDLVEWAAALGVGLETSQAPRGDAGWSAAFAPGRETLLSLRMFHRRFPLSLVERRERGHEWRVLHHQVYLLGAFDSPSLGRRLYLLQDSGSGETLMATAAELTALTMDRQTVTIAAPVVVPSAR